MQFLASGGKYKPFFFIFYCFSHQVLTNAYVDTWYRSVLVRHANLCTLMEWKREKRKRKMKKKQIRGLIIPSTILSLFDLGLPRFSSHPYPSWIVKASLTFCNEFPMAYWVVTMFQHYINVGSHVDDKMRQDLKPLNDCHHMHNSCTFI